MKFRDITYLTCGRFQFTIDLELRLLRKDSKEVKYHFNNNNKLNKLINEQVCEI